MREYTSIQYNLCLSIFLILIDNTSVLQPSYPFLQTFTRITQSFKLNDSCFPGPNAYVEFLQAAQVELIRLGGTRRTSSQFSTCQLCSTTHFAQSNTDADGLLSRAIAVVDVRLVLDLVLVLVPHDMAFSLCA